MTQWLSPNPPIYGVEAYQQVGFRVVSESAADIRAVSELAATRLAEHAKLGAVSTDANTGWQTLSLTTGHVGVEIGVDTDGTVSLFYLAPDEPTCTLKQVDGVLMQKDRRPGTPRDWRFLTDLVQQGHILLPELVPFATHESGIVTGCVWMGALYQDGSIRDRSPNCYVLEGWPQPELLRYRDNPKEHLAAIWDAVRTGKMLRLGQRLGGTYQQPSRWIWDGKLARITVQVDTGQAPRLATLPNSRYVEWQMTLPHPGRDGPYIDLAGPVRNRLDTWFKD